MGCLDFDWIVCGLFSGFWIFEPNEMEWRLSNAIVLVRHADIRYYTLAHSHPKRVALARNPDTRIRCRNMDGLFGWADLLTSTMKRNCSHG